MKLPNKWATCKDAHAVLALADGSIFEGVAIGAPGQTCGEVVFNTAMTGYQEILTDPSYSRQLVTLTCPHVGNTGVNPEDAESSRVHAAGLIIKNIPWKASSHRATQNFSEYLQAQGVVAIAGLDTRRLTRRLRETGAQAGAIVVRPESSESAVLLARSFPGLAGLDLAREVSTQNAYVWQQGLWHLGSGADELLPLTDAPHVVAYDFGVKYNILRMLVARGCRVSVMPAQSTAAEVLALQPDGVFLSNGPGDPQPCEYAIAASRELIEHGIPAFGICLGHQIMALASGARTMKMKFGHHGANHPVQEIASGKILITSQNHGFAVDPSSLPGNCRVTHISLFDGSLQGFMRTDRPAFCFQGHPEASPGPNDIGHLFDQFVNLMRSHRHAQAH